MRIRTLVTAGLGAAAGAGAMYLLDPEHGPQRRREARRSALRRARDRAVRAASGAARTARDVAVRARAGYEEASG